MIEIMYVWAVISILFLCQLEINPESAFSFLLTQDLLQESLDIDYASMNKL